MPDWVLIEDLYRNSDQMITEIASLCGVSAPSISRRASNEGWPPRGRRRSGIAPRPATIKERLLIAMEKKLSQIEERLDEAAPSSLADSERETRELGSLARNLERLGAVETAKTGSRPERTVTEQAKGEDDAERWRLELAQRIARLKEQLRA